MKRAALIVGSGISTEIVPHVLELLAAAGSRVEWDRIDVPTLGDPESEGLLDIAVEAVERNGTGLKTRLFGRTSEEAGGGADPGARNPNVLLRRRLGLFAGVMPIKAIAGLKTRYEGLDLLLIRESTEDIYKGIEHEIVDGVVETMKVVTRDACQRIARFAFEAARTLDRSHLTFIHKANIMKMSDGLFLDCVRSVAAENKDIGYREMIVDAACMQLVLDPFQFDVLLAGNLYGDIIGNLGSGLTGGISSAYSVSIGDNCRLYESLHGDAQHLEGTGLANPLPILRPAVALLEHLGERAVSARLEAAIAKILANSETTTQDLGGKASTEQMTGAIAAALES